eukprot:2748614-Rhodomonas_salina.1
MRCSKPPEMVLRRTVGCVIVTMAGLGAEDIGKEAISDRRWSQHRNDSTFGTDSGSQLETLQRRSAVRKSKNTSSGGKGGCNEMT